MHWGLDPRPPFWLLVTQMVSFSSLAWEFSADSDSSANSSVSITLMDPEMANVLFFDAAAIEAWADSAHSQQLDWQIWVNWVSGTAERVETWDASALYSKPYATPFPRPGRVLNTQGHSGSAITGGGVHVVGIPCSTKLWELTCPSLDLRLLLGAAIAPTSKTIKTIADWVLICNCD